MSYLTKRYNMRHVAGATVLNVSFGTSSMTPLLVAYLSDAYFGRFWAVVLSCFCNLLGSLFLTISAVSSSLRPGPQQEAAGGQLAFLFTALLFNAIGGGGLWACTSAFGADQFNKSGPEDKKQVQSFFNWYYFFTYIGTLLGSTVLVYLQENMGWVWGYGVPAVASFLSLLIFALGFPFYRYVDPTGSPFTRLAQVVVAAFRKRNLSLSSDSDELAQDRTENSLLGGTKRPPTTQFKCLDRAAVRTKEDFGGNPWRLCTVDQVEEFKALIKLIPIWFSCLLSATALSGHKLFVVPQANTMDRHLGSSFQLPAASLPIFGSITFLLWVPIYDRLILPIARKVTGHQRGITMLQRIGIGFCVSILELAVGGLVESKRRAVARSTGFIDKPYNTIPMSVFWLAPQFCLHGLGESFWAVGELDFFYDQLPATMRSMAAAIYWLSSGIGHYMGTVILVAVHRMTGHHGHEEDWLGNNLNTGHLDYFFYLLGMVEIVNLVFFLVISRWYTYKSTEVE
eukprot:c28984_g1_i4 orf=563-2095(+)